MMKMGPVEVRCPVCRTLIPVPAEATGTREGNLQVQIDPTPLREHVNECATQAAAAGKQLERTSTTKVSYAELAGRIRRMLDTGAYLTRGRRSCTMCGVPNSDCMTGIRKNRVPCCAACGIGGTHPVPGAATPCAVWGREQAEAGGQ